MAPPPGDEIDGYRLERALGRGGMGTVWQAVDPAGARRALKVPSPLAGPEELLRFEREAQALARVPPHPGVVRVHAAGRAAGRPYCVLELVEGESLAEVLRRGPLAPARAAEVVARVARALAHVHAAGVLHRDLKPENILLRPDGTPVLVDFGLARDVAQDRLTRTGEVLGTPAYMAPEQAEGRRAVDARADVYGLGATLFALLVGRPPFEGRSPLAVLERVLAGPPPRPSAVRADVPPALDVVVLRAMARDPAARFPDAASLAEALERPAPAGGGRGRAGRAAVAAAGVAVAGGLAAWALSRRPAPGGGGAASGATVDVAPAATPAAPPRPAPREEVLARARRSAALSGAELRARRGVIVEQLVTDAARHGLDVAGEAAGALLAASAADDEAVADLALALDARSPTLLDRAPVPARVAAPLLRRTTARGSELRAALEAFGTALRADPTLPPPLTLARRTSDWGDLRDPARDTPLALAELLVALARADLPAPRPADGDRLGPLIEQALRARADLAPEDPGVRLALVQLVGDDAEGLDPAGVARQEECVALLADVPDARAPLRLRLRADLLLARLEVALRRADRATFHARRALRRGSPVPDLCCAVVLDATWPAVVSEPPSSPALAETIAWAGATLAFAVDRSARTAADDLRRPGFPALDRCATEDVRRLPQRRADLARYLAWAGRFDEARAVADGARGLDGNHRATFQMIRAIVDLRAGDDALARRRLEDLGPEHLPEAQLLVVQSLVRAGEADAAARAARLLDALGAR